MTFGFSERELLRRSQSYGLVIDKETIVLMASQNEGFPNKIYYRHD